MANYIYVEPKRKRGDELPFFIADPVAGDGGNSVSGTLVDDRGLVIEHEFTFKRRTYKVCRAIMHERRGVLVPV